MPPKKKKPTAALAALASRRSAQKVEANNKHGLEPESEDDSHPATSGKRQRSGTFSKGNTISSEAGGLPDIPESVPKAPARPRPRPRPVPPTQGDESAQESTTHTLVLTQEPGVKVIVMSSVEGLPVKEADAAEGALAPSPTGALQLDVKLKSEGEHTVGNQARPNTVDSGMSGIITKGEPITDDSEHASDSDVIVVEEVGSQGSDRGTRFWPSLSDDAQETATETITYKLPPKVVQQARETWTDTVYEDDEEMDYFAPLAKEEKPSLKRTPKVKSERKEDPVGNSKSTHPGRPKKASQQPATKESTPARSNQTRGRAKVESSDEGSDDGTGGAEEVDDDEDSCAEYEDGVKLPDGVVMLQFEVPRFKGIRIMKLRSDSSYRKFCRSTADILDCSINDLNVGYSAGKPKELKGKLTPRVIENEEDYDEMVADAVRAIETERNRYRKEKEAVAKAAAKTKGKAGAPSKKKVAPIQPYVIKLALTDKDDPKDKKKSAKKKGSKSKGICDTDGPRDDDEGLPSRQLNWFERLQARHFCATHQRVCAVLPGRPNEAGAHVRLEKSDLLLWAEMLAKNHPEASINCPPNVLNVQSRVRKEAEEQKVAVTVSAGSEAKSSAAQEALAPLQAAQMMMPWLYGQAGMFFPPFLGSGAPNSYAGGPQMPQFPGAIAPAPAPPPAAAQAPPADPLLSDWLNHCDSGPRGVDHHNFQSYLPAFSSSMMTRLSDIARFDSARQLIDSIAEYQPKMPFGTASRLIEYAKVDYR